MTTINALALSDLRAALRDGWQDLRRAPLFGLFFASVYVITGLLLTLLGAGTFTWTLVLSLGFPLIAPFAAVGFYEVSRRLEAGEPLTWSGVLGVVWAERGRQLPWMGAILGIIFLFWSFFAHMSFALFLGSMSGANITTSWEPFLTPGGLAMMGFQGIAGGLVALLTFSLTVISLPMLLDREVDFVTAMLTSLKVIRHNPGPLLIWAATIALCLFVGMLPLFLGLFIALPVLGHATWHLYRRALPAA